ncbi:hypothetical protein Kpol_1072p17 [Vanderwaltozyma polyspora DSM 70294]|uniref:Pre-mRNA-splicing factor PRP46 n=1 Tax=Vanderwaltozyma polyspora (strain ATCC 22028 / DSM 70294 / BCRC 21397 / CBS 2163 / NBRC 10782 / NRRL Y-8283 / UCD 57-17) TaxID=436907 RepID=A7TKN5_VANPO|nr:uncharacterized protein Kpol_1072p17 [Vanderwaltozyma polyspora DSM 70294]EDO17147.1 hypothetical protein Kpol_1072p17 [Vanderwaltozyma polyspora DSM 70294]
MSNHEDISTVDEVDKFYTDIRWNNQFKHMGTLPKHLQDVINEKSSILIGDGEGTVSSGLKVHDSVVDQMVKADERNISNQVAMTAGNGKSSSVMGRYNELLLQRPEWHAPWKLMRVINGHMGWVNCVASEPVENTWFATGSTDTTVKVWDLVSGHLKLTLSGHVMPVRDITVSDRHPYLFSASEDKLVKCWDLEKNMAIRDYHGHLSGVYSVAIHPTLDLIATAGRDSVVRLWDIRSRMEVMTLIGHKGPINKVRSLPVDPQIISCSTDATVHLWDIVAGKSAKVLTHHKRSVRDIALNPSEFSLASACTDDIRSWRLPEGSLLTNFESESSGIINSLSINQDGVLAAGCDNGTLAFYDFKSGHKYQSLESPAVAGSLESERGILSSTFDQSGLRLITGGVDKSIKIWKQDDLATEVSNPGLPWNPLLSSQRF